MEPILTINHVSAAYGKRPVLEDVTFSVAPGSLTAIIGPSGCGKSTLLSCVNRMIELEPRASWQGTVLLEGQDTRGLAAEEVRRRIGLLSQTPTPFPFSIERNLTYALRARGHTDRRRLRETARDALTAVGLLDELGGDLRRSALALSGGQQQRLCLARALAVGPEVLLLDEPCSALDVASTRAIEKTLVALKRTTTIVMVTHNLAQARRLADEVVCLAEGAQAWSGPAADLFGNGGGEAVLQRLYGEEIS